MKIVLLVLIVCVCGTHAYTRMISAPDPINGITFEPTYTSTFPFSMRYASGAPFSLVPNYYGCAYTESGGAYAIYGAGVSASDPTVIRCGYEVILLGCDMDVYLFGNYSASVDASNMNTLIMLASWLGGLNPSTGPTARSPCSPQPTNNYYGVTQSQWQSLATQSVQVQFTRQQLSSSSGTVGSSVWDPNMWYVCAWYIYTAVNLDVGLLIYPEPGWTNFTVTSGTSGYCSSPVITQVSNGNLPLVVNHVDVVAYDGSFDTWNCDSVGTCNQCFEFQTQLAPASDNPCPASSGWSLAPASFFVLVAAATCA